MITRATKCEKIFSSNADRKYLENTGFLDPVPVPWRGTFFGKLPPQDAAGGGDGPPDRGSHETGDGHLECRITHNFSSFSFSSLDNFLITTKLIFSLS